MVVNRLYVIGYMAQIITDKGKISLFRFDISDLADSLNGAVVRNITTKAINRIGRINNQAAFAQHLNNLVNGFWIGVFGVDLYKHDATQI